jgi:hypothetical protein
MLWFSPKENHLIGFEDVKCALQPSNGIKLINTLPSSEQDCLIRETLSYEREETVINQWIENSQMDTTIVLYGKHSADDSVEKKRKQLVSFGFTKVYIYGGGLFEWLLLQDVYGQEEFPTTSPCRDLLKYRAAQVL